MCSSHKEDKIWIGHGGNMASVPSSPCQGRNQYQLFSLGCAWSAWDKRRPWRQGEETPKPRDLVLLDNGTRE